MREFEMTMTKTTIISTLAAVGLAITTSAAFAAPAQSTTALNVRSGPGTGYGVVDTLFAGENVEVTECVSNGWCHIQHPGPDGWVSSKYLVAGGSGGGSSSGGSNDPDINFGIGVDSNGNLSFGIGIGDAPIFQTPTAPTPAAGKVCFYKKKNYKGASFCVSPGSKDNKLSGNWNNKISSIKLFDGASVEVCRNINYGGTCKTYGSSKKKLGILMNNRITSFKAF
jgi:uncharacterized protein YraI